MKFSRVVISTRSVDMNLARHFNAGKDNNRECLRRVATLESNVATRLDLAWHLDPGVETPG
jgi:hypothetical protein